ncbi:phage protein [Staphylococcus aureus]|nr:phage protein [Staphylococcus aureus]
MSVISNRKVDMNEAQDNVKQPAHYNTATLKL